MCISSAPIFVLPELVEGHRVPFDNARENGGFTLIELIVFIVIVSVGLAGVLLIFDTVTRGSADPVRAKQALAVAEGLMDEILTKSFCDPDTEAFPVSGTVAPATCGAHTTEASRISYDDTDDYNAYPAGSVRDISNASITALSTYTASQTVATPPSNFVFGGVTITPTNYRIVTVSVTDTVTGQRYDLTAYKFNND